MIDDKKAVILILLALSAACDIVDHNLLLWRMVTRLGIGGTVLTWLNSYLSGRGQSQHRIGIFTFSYATIWSPSGVSPRIHPLFHYLYTSHWRHRTNSWFKGSFLFRRYSAIRGICPYWSWCDASLYNIHSSLLTMKIQHQYSLRLKTVSAIYVSGWSKTS